MSDRMGKRRWKYLAKSNYERSQGMRVGRGKRDGNLRCVKKVPVRLGIF